jgi:preprotein translocase subunit SecA
VRHFARRKRPFKEVKCYKGLAKSIFGSSNDRYVAKLRRIVETINGMRRRSRLCRTNELKGQTARFRQRLENGAKLDDLLPEAFATVREAGQADARSAHYDVQMIGGIALHRGEIAEMRTGEGKTLVADAGDLPQRVAGQGRPRRHGERLSRPAATPSGWARSTTTWA